MIYTISDIDYDTDGEDIDLPQTLEIIVDENDFETTEDIYEFISDEISNQTEYCHFGFIVEPKISLC